jgi:hypothetical protein
MKNPPPVACFLGDEMSFDRFQDQQIEFERRQHDHRYPEHATVLLAVTAAAQILGSDHPASKALAKAAGSMDKGDLWNARLQIKRLRPELREAIARAGEG